MGFFSVATLDRLKPPARDPRKATWCGAFLTLLGVPGALAVACYFVIRAELAVPVIETSTTNYIQSSGPYRMPVTCRSPNGCLVTSSYEEQPEHASACESMDRWRPLRYGETAMLQTCYSPGLRDGIYIIWNRYPQRVLNGSTTTDIPPELLWPSYYGEDGLRLKDNAGKMFFPFGASTVYRGLKEASLSAGSAEGAARSCPSALKSLIATMDREAEATSLCNGELAKAANDATKKKSGERLMVNSKIASAGKDGQRTYGKTNPVTHSRAAGPGRRLQHVTTHMVASLSHVRTPAPTTARGSDDVGNFRVNTNAANTELSLLGGSTGDDQKTVHTNLGRLSSGLKITPAPTRGMGRRSGGVFGNLAGAGWFSADNVEQNYDGVDAPDGVGGVGLRDLPADEIVAICDAINTRTTAIPHGTSLITMNVQDFNKFSCGSDGGLFPVRTDDDTSSTAPGAAKERTDSVVSFTPVNVDAGPFANEHDKGGKPWLARMPHSEAIGPLLLEREIIRTPSAGKRMMTGTRADRAAIARRFFQSETNSAYFRSNIVHSHLKLMPIATHTLFERKQIFALVLAALGGFFALTLAGGRLLALLYLHCTRKAPNNEKAAGADGGSDDAVAIAVVTAGRGGGCGGRLRKKHQTSALELLAVPDGSSRSVPVMTENPAFLRRANTTASAV